jgi:hypothetical protein
MGGTNINIGDYMKLIAFSLLLISEFAIEKWRFSYVIQNSFENPFWIGALCMVVAYLIYLNFLNIKFPEYDIRQSAMTVFIISKIIAQLYHGKDFLNAWGLKKLISH